MSLIAAACFLSSRIRVYFVGCAWHRRIADYSYVPLCSLCLTPMDFLACPTYALLHVLHFSLYIPLGLVLFCFSDNCCCKVLVALNAIFISVCLNRFVIRLIIRL